MKTPFLLPKSLFLLGERDEGHFILCGELGPHGTWRSCWAAGWLLWHPVGWVTERSQKSLISNQKFPHHQTPVIQLLGGIIVQVPNTSLRTNHFSPR